jgi:hypothetical protein
MQQLLHAPFLVNTDSTYQPNEDEEEEEEEDPETEQLREFAGDDEEGEDGKRVVKR